MEFQIKYPDKSSGGFVKSEQVKIANLLSKIGDFWQY